MQLRLGQCSERKEDEMSCTQDGEQEEETGLGRQGSSDGTYGPITHPPEVPTARRVTPALGGSAISVLSNLVT